MTDNNVGAEDIQIPDPLLAKPLTISIKIPGQCWVRATAENPSDLWIGDALYY